MSLTDAGYYEIVALTLLVQLLTICCFSLLNFDMRLDSLQCEILLFALYSCEIFVNETHKQRKIGSVIGQFQNC